MLRHRKKNIGFLTSWAMAQDGNPAFSWRTPLTRHPLFVLVRFRSDLFISLLPTSAPTHLHPSACLYSKRGHVFFFCTSLNRITRTRQALHSKTSKKPEIQIHEKKGKGKGGGASEVTITNELGKTKREIKNTEKKWGKKGKRRERAIDGASTASARSSSFLGACSPFCPHDQPPDTTTPRSTPFLFLSHFIFLFPALFLSPRVFSFKGLLLFKNARLSAASPHSRMPPFSSLFKYDTSPVHSPHFAMELRVRGYTGSSVRRQSFVFSVAAFEKWRVAAGEERGGGWETSCVCERDTRAVSRPILLMSNGLSVCAKKGGRRWFHRVSILSLVATVYPNSGRSKCLDRLVIFHSAQGIFLQATLCTTFGLFGNI